MGHVKTGGDPVRKADGTILRFFSICEAAEHVGMSRYGLTLRMKRNEPTNCDGVVVYFASTPTLSARDKNKRDLAQAEQHQFQGESVRFPYVSTMHYKYMVLK